LPDFGVEFQGVRPLWLILLPVAALLIVWWTYRRTYPTVGTWYRLLLLGLRIAVVGLAGMLLFEPVLSMTRLKSRPERIAVLVDRSASMLLPAAAGESDGTDRGETALRIVARSIEGSPGEREKDLFAFGGELTAVDSPGGLCAVMEDRTDLYSALKDLLPGGTSRWDRIYVISDGRVNSGADPAAAFETAAGSLPVIQTLIVGEPPGLPDAALVGIERLGGRIFAGGEIELEISVLVNRPATAGHPLESPALAVADIFLDGRKVAQKRIPLEAGLSRFVSSRVKVKAGDPGLKLVRVVLRPLEEEWTTLNNERLLFVEVVKSKQEILLVSNNPDWDFSFLQDAMLSNEEWKVESLIILRSAEAGDFIRHLNSQGVYSSGSHPSARELQEVELVLVHGDLSRYDTGFLTRLAGRAAKGGFGLVIWPTGELAAATLPRAFADYLPFKGRLPAGFRQIAGGQQPAVVFTLDCYNILAGLGTGAPLENLPPLEWVFPEAPLKVGAEVLARVSPGRRRDKAGGPVLTARPVRQSRVATVLGRGLWRWHMLAQSSEKKRDTSYYRLWDELIEWLLGSEKSTELTLKPRRPVFAFGEKVRIDGLCRQPEDRETAVDTLNSVKVVVLRQGEQEDTVVVSEVTPQQEDGKFTVEPGRLAPGLYRCEGFSSGRKAYGRFAVERYSPELTELAPDTTLLAGLSRRTGGSIAAGGDLESLAGAGETIEEEVKTFHPSTSSWVYLLLVVLLAAEWILRRRKSLA